jgi:hypothetical protein
VSWLYFYFAGHLADSVEHVMCPLQCAQ